MRGNFHYDFLQALTKVFTKWYFLKLIGAIKLDQGDQRLVVSQKKCLSKLFYYIINGVILSILNTSPNDILVT